MMGEQEDRDRDVRERAYAMWEAEGRPDGRHEAHWHDASRALDESSGTEVEISADAGALDAAAEPTVPLEAGAASGAGQDEPEPVLAENTPAAPAEKSVKRATKPRAVKPRKSAG